MATSRRVKQTLWETCSYSADGTFEPSGMMYSDRAEAERDLDRHPHTFLVKVELTKMPRRRSPARP